MRCSLAFLVVGSAFVPSSSALPVADAINQVIIIITIIITIIIITIVIVIVIIIIIIHFYHRQDIQMDNALIAEEEELAGEEVKGEVVR